MESGRKSSTSNCFWPLLRKVGMKSQTPTAKGTEPRVARPALESPAEEERLMEEVCDRQNLEIAWKRVRGNKGSPGIDGMTIDAAVDYLREHWPTIRSQLLNGAYQPQPVRRVEIPKPDGGVRKLGVPCVVDRLIQQAVSPGSPTAVGPDVFRAQLRFPTGTLRPSGRGPSAMLHCRGLQLCGRHRSGEVLRSSQPRHPDGTHRGTNLR